jgi:hypothetical protein
MDGWLSETRKNQEEEEGKTFKYTLGKCFSCCKLSSLEVGIKIIFLRLRKLSFLEGKTLKQNFHWTVEDFIDDFVNFLEMV